jgi:hypothetical protein
VLDKRNNFIHTCTTKLNTNNCVASAGFGQCDF